MRAVVRTVQDGAAQLRRTARAAAAPELEQLGLNHINPFEYSGFLKVQAAREQERLQARAKRSEAMLEWMGRWKEHQETTFPDRGAVPAHSARWEGAHANDAEVSKLSAFNLATGEWGPDTWVPEDYSAMGGPE